MYQLPGDIIFFRSNSDGWYHTGIVENVSGGNVNTIEGNCNNCVCRQAHAINWSNIAGYGLNGGIVADDTDLLQDAGRVGIFEHRHINPPGFSKKFL